MYVGALNRQSAVRSLVLGDLRLTYVVDGGMAMLPEAFFPTFTQDYWDAHPEALDEKGQLAMSAGGLLVERDGRCILIDAGLGSTRGPIHVNGVLVGHSDCGTLPQVLAALGHSSEDIEAVAFTHLHVDHTGWAFAPTKVFPRARYIVAAQEWNLHKSGIAAPGAPAADMLNLIEEAHTSVDDGEEIFPGVQALVTPGHSSGHTSYIVSTGAMRAVVFGDVFHTPAQLAHPDWPSLPDADHSRVAAARKRITAELQQPGTVGFAFHFGDQVFGRLEGTNWVPVPAPALFPAPRTV